MPDALGGPGVITRPGSESDEGVVAELLGGQDPYGVHGRRARVVVDIGANIGAFSVLARTLWPKARIVAYEPEPENFALLERNTARLEVERHRQAVGAERGTLTLSAWDGLTHVCDDGPVCRSSICQGRRFTAESVTLADALPEDTDVLKVDTEGGEFAIFAGAPADVIARAAYLTMEIHDYLGPDALATLWHKLGETHAMTVSAFRAGHGGFWHGERR